MKKVEILTKVAESAGKDITQAYLLLGRLAERATGAADLAGNVDHPEHRANALETMSLLYEFGQVLGLIAASLESLNDNLLEVASEASDEIKKEAA